ncbi:MAG: acetylornithine deacetylase, partial [Candidatus Cryptobacteroides sp.]
IDIRPTELYSCQEILDELQALCRSRLSARNLGNRSSATKTGSPLRKAIDELGISTFSSPTTSDWMRIDSDCIKIGPGESSRSHKSDEFITTAEVQEGIDTYINLIGELAKLF